MFEVERARALSALGETQEAGEILLGIVPRLSAAAPRDAVRAYSAVADVFRKQGDLPHAPSSSTSSRSTRRRSPTGTSLLH